jgi:hypothetical protein
MNIDEEGDSHPHNGGGGPRPQDVVDGDERRAVRHFGMGEIVEKQATIAGCRFTLQQARKTDQHSEHAGRAHTPHAQQCGAKQEADEGEQARNKSEAEEQCIGIDPTGRATEDQPDAG